MTIIYRYPPQSVSVSVPPLEFNLNGVDTTVSRDTATPANSNPLPIIQLDGSGAVASPLTDTQLRASPVPVSGPLTDTQLRSAAVPISAASLPLPSGAATLVEQQTQSTRLGDVAEVAPATDTASSGINGRLQRIAQRLSSLISLLPISLGQKTSAASLAVVVSSDQSAIPVSGPLTDVQLRATAVPVSGPATNAELRATALPVSGPLTDAQLRATAVPVSPSALVGSYQENLTLGTVAATFTAPAGSKWFKIQADGTNTANIRWKVGAEASATSGMPLDPGRSEDASLSGNISVIAESGTQKVYVQFGA